MKYTIERKENELSNTSDEVNIIGMLEIDAIALLKEKNIKYRIMSKNGENYMGTCDYVPTRWNLNINKDIITGVSFG